jgi:phosphoribosylformimino-5-aminoimidazole carboxamide ribotide isomerase
MINIEQIAPELTWSLRKKVLYPEGELQEMCLEEDGGGWHFGAFLDNSLVGVISLFKHEDDFQFRKFAVDPEWQRKGIGNRLLKHTVEFAISAGAKRIWCNARINALDFYLKNDFEHTGDLFSKNGIGYEVLEKKVGNRQKQSVNLISKKQ